MELDLVTLEIIQGKTNDDNFINYLKIFKLFEDFGYDEHIQDIETLVDSEDMLGNNIMFELNTLLKEHITSVFDLIGIKVNDAKLYNYTDILSAIVNIKDTELNKPLEDILMVDFLTTEEKLSQMIEHVSGIAWLNTFIILESVNPKLLENIKNGWEKEDIEEAASLFRMFDIISDYKFPTYIALTPESVDMDMEFSDYLRGYSEIFNESKEDKLSALFMFMLLTQDTGEDMRKLLNDEVYEIIDKNEIDFIEENIERYIQKFEGYKHVI